MNIYSLDNLLIGSANLINTGGPNPSKLLFSLCVIDRDYYALELTEGIKLEGCEGLWHIDSNLNYSAANKKIVFEDGYFYQ